MSDVHITEKSGIIKELIPGDVILADKGFTINAQYTSEQIKQELVQALASTIAKPILETCTSPSFLCALTKPITKQLIVYGHYLVKRDVHTSFLKILELPDGTAKTIVHAVCQICDELGLDLQNTFCALGSDGTSVILGVQRGVAKLPQNSRAPRWHSKDNHSCCLPNM